MKGGHPHSGPPPDPSALRRERDGAAWVDLPATGRDGEPPVWPLSRPARREVELWTSEWARPQALMWERNGQEVEVALYVRTLVLAERPKAPISSRVLVRQQQEALGLSLPGLARLRWRIVAQATQSERPPSPTGLSARDRLKVVQGAA